MSAQGIGEHVKLTAAHQRGLGPIELHTLWKLILNGDLVRLAVQLEDHERGAVNLGRRWVVFQIDRDDAAVLTFVTLLDGRVEHVMPKHATRPLVPAAIFAVDSGELKRFMRAKGAT